MKKACTFFSFCSDSQMSSTGRILTGESYESLYRTMWLTVVYLVIRKEKKSLCGILWEIRMCEDMLFMHIRWKKLLG